MGSQLFGKFLNLDDLKTLMSLNKTDVPQMFSLLCMYIMCAVFLIYKYKLTEMFNVL